MGGVFSPVCKTRPNRPSCKCDDLFHQKYGPTSSLPPEELLEIAVAVLGCHCKNQPLSPGWHERDVPGGQSHRFIDPSFYCQSGGDQDLTPKNPNAAGCLFKFLQKVLYQYAVNATNFDLNFISLFCWSLDEKKTKKFNRGLFAKIRDLKKIRSIYPSHPRNRNQSTNHNNPKLFHCKTFTWAVIILPTPVGFFIGHEILPCFFFPGSPKKKQTASQAPW